jgi:hypothetical protein
VEEISLTGFHKSHREDQITSTHSIGAGTP